MSYAEVAKTLILKDSEIRTIRSQAETELGKQLDQKDESLLLARFKRDQLCEHIQKVCLQSLSLCNPTLIHLIYLVWIWCPQVQSTFV